MAKTPRDETPHTLIYTVRADLATALIHGMTFVTRSISYPNSEKALDHKDRLVREHEGNSVEHLYYAAVIRDSDGYSISSSTHSPRGGDCK